MTPAAAELLSPAGDRACFVGALSAGADAVYLAGQKFGARAYAGNFTSEELITSIREAHALHRRVYLTANILTREDELDETVDFVCEMASHGLDGVIVQDLGVAARVHEAFPDLPIHASTQMSSTTAESVHFLKQLGVSRIVPARELSLDEIRLLKAQDIEIEAFIHGAMCYSYSGRCLFSSFLGGRSGNRGRCAGTCRLPFSVSDESGRKVMETAYPISMKDMTVLEILPELLDAGIDSFKIEGRMKRPEYAAGVTSVYRRYIDRYIAWTNSGRKEPWRIDREDIDFLSNLYIRTAKSTGYYHTQNGPSLITIGKPGYAGTDDALLKEIHDRYCRALPVREIGARVFLRVGEPAGLYLYDPADPSVCAYRTGDVVQKADKRPLTVDEIRAKVTKTGGTPFAFTAFEIESDDDAFLPVSALGRLRRDALDAFWDELTEAARKKQKPENAAKSLFENKPPVMHASSAPADRIWAQVGTKEQYLAAIGAGVRHVILDAPAGSALYETLRKDAGFLCGDAAHYLAFPEIMREAHRSDYLEMLSLVREEQNRISGVLARTAEHLCFLKEAEYDGTVIADAGIYTWNTKTLSILTPYCDLQVFPHELSGAQLLSAFGNAAGSRFLLTVYGRQPMMVSAGCVRKTTGSCAHGGTSFWHLRDRMGEDFPVQCVCGKDGELCHNVVLNAHPLSLHNYLGDPLPQKAKGLRLLFTTESGSKTQQILSAYLSRLNGDDCGEKDVFRSMKFTTGHYLKSAL